MGKRNSLDCGTSCSVIPGDVGPHSYRGPAPAFPEERRELTAAPRGSYENVVAEGVHVTDALFGGCPATPVAKLSADEVSHLIAQAPDVRARAMHAGGHHVELVLPSGRKVWGAPVGTGTGFTHVSPGIFGH